MNNIKQIEVRTEFGQCCLLIYLDDFSTGYLTNIEIFKEHRLQGHGNELLETALRIAKQQNLSCVVLQVVADSFVRHWYEKYGFRNLNVYQHSPQEGHIWMTKEMKMERLVIEKRDYSDVEDALKCSGKAEQIAELINDFEYELKNCHLADEPLQKKLDEINSFFSEESERLMKLAESKFR